MCSQTGFVHGLFRYQKRQQPPAYVQIAVGLEGRVAVDTGACGFMDPTYEA